MTWLVTLGGGTKSIIGIRKLQLSSKEKKLFSGTANNGGALTPLSPMLCLCTYPKQFVKPNTDIGSNANTTFQPIQP
jgi:hypothetical protein